MYRKLFKFMTFVVSILLVYLLTESLENYLFNKYQHSLNPFIFTAVAMVVVLFIFYPLYNWLDDFVAKFSKYFLDSGKKLTGKKRGTFFVFILLIVILYVFYVKLWFDINAWDYFIKHAIMKRQ